MINDFIILFIYIYSHCIDFIMKIASQYLFLAMLEELVLFFIGIEVEIFREINDAFVCVFYFRSVLNVWEYLNECLFYEGFCM